jgi:hypothetical protein
MIARETGFKRGQPIRVFPFGYVAHNEADPSAPLDTVVTVGAGSRDCGDLGTQRRVDLHRHIQQPRHRRGTGRAGKRATSETALVLDFVFGLLGELDDVAFPEEDLS